MSKEQPPSTPLSVRLTSVSKLVAAGGGALVFILGIAFTVKLNDAVSTVSTWWPVLAAMAGLALMVGGGVLIVQGIRYRRSLTIRDQSDAGERLGLRVLGACGAIRMESDFLAPRSPLSEVVDSALLALTSGSEPLARLIVVASASYVPARVPIAILLARKLARRGSRTLLVDGDLRWPLLSQMLGLDRRDGLSGALYEQLGVADCIVASSDPHLYILPAGLVPLSASESLNQPAIRRLLDELQGPMKLGEMPALFDKIVVNVAPLADFADANSILKSGPDVVLACECRRTTVRSLDEAQRKLLWAGCRLRGVILTDERSTSGMTQHGYHYDGYEA